MATSLRFSKPDTATGPPTLWSTLFSSRTVTTSFLGAEVTTTSPVTGWGLVKQTLLEEKVASVAAVAAATACLVSPVGGLAALSALAAAMYVSSGKPDEVVCPTVVEAMAADVVRIGTETTVDGALLDDALGQPEREVTKATRKWVRKTKLHFGEVKDTPADQLCVKRWLAEQMKAEDVRDKDARALVPIVAFLATVPDQDDILANFLRHSVVVRHARVLGGNSVGA